MKKASEQEIAAALKDLPGWKHAGQSIVRTFKFTDFRGAFAFMTHAALLAEKHDHHPDWTNVYNKLEIRLSTHDSGGVTARDFKLARAINEIV